MFTDSIQFEQNAVSLDHTPSSGSGFSLWGCCACSLNLINLSEWTRKFEKYQIKWEKLKMLSRKCDMMEKYS